ncbi:demethoxyubiquinone hydroxylase family protein, partial [Maricaulis sp.]|uniref:demethoxyubiquinone hydroxylase family protein n=1 Tax=Maricaulis sp. TaxID=1486257 RepID=UPI003A951470
PDRIEQMLGVAHAGEYGAVAIYGGQRAIYGKLPHKARIARQLEEMEADEQAHLDAFDALLVEHRARPTALGPVWNMAGHALGAVTALMGDKAAHACTEAVETVIEQHYAGQITELRAMGEDALADRFDQFRMEELAHRDLAVEEGAKDAPGYPLLSGLIQAGCRLAIKVSEKV